MGARARAIIQCLLKLQTYESDSHVEFSFVKKKIGKLKKKNGTEHNAFLEKPKVEISYSSIS